jgi:hypothetical protein
MGEHIHTHIIDDEHSYMHTHGHIHENQKAVVNRLARAIGHLEKVKRMVEEGHDCTEVLVQWRLLENSRSFDKRRSAKNRWLIYRKYLKLSPWKSAWYFACYAAAGVKKYLSC